MMGGSALFLVALFTVPYHVPVSPTASLSYAFGYSNHTALLLVFLWAAFLAAFGPQLTLGTPAATKPLGRSTLYKALAGTFLLGTMLSLLTRSLDGLNESIYLIDRIWYAAQGKVAYKEFEYAYGAFFLYGPAMLYRWFHLSLSDAYDVFWLGLNLIGTWMAWQVILWLDEPTGKQRTIFLFLWAMGLFSMFTVGVNYSIFRFVLPCFLGLAVYRHLLRAAADGRWLWAILSPIVYMAAILLVSPELALAFGAGSMAFVPWFAWLQPKRPNLALLLLLPAGLAVDVWLAWRAGALTTTFAFSSGGMNFPLTLNPFLLLLLVGIGLSACYAGTCLRARRPTAMLMLIAVSMLALAGALGRCDPGHLISNPYGIIIAAILIASGLGRAGRWYYPALWILFFLLPLIPLLRSLPALVGKALLPVLLAGEPAQQTTALDHWILVRMERELGPEAAARKFATFKNFAHLHQIDPPQIFGLPESTVFEAPLGFTASHFGLYHSPLIDQGYFHEHINVVTPKQVERKTEELASHPERPLLLMPELWADICGPQPSLAEQEDGARQYIRSMFLTPYSRKLQHPENVLQPFCSYVAQHYHLAQEATPEHFGYALWLPDR